MLRLRELILFVGFAFLASTAALAEEIRIVGGGFQFLHAPVNPSMPDGFCDDPPGFLFSVSSDTFNGELNTKGGVIPFVGVGDASGCAYLEPVFGLSASFSGSFTWSTAEGDLQGTFELLDFVTEIEGVFAALILIKFDGGTGKFQSARGRAIASGLDLPFGGLNGGGSGGVVGEIIAGRITL